MGSRSMSLDAPSHAIVLVAGVSACLKSDFGRWLVRHKGFTHLELDRQDRALERAGLRPSWDRIFMPDGSGVAFVGALRLTGKPTVLDWGFPPNEVCLRAVQVLRRAGVVVWWFEGDRAAARAAFIGRGEGRVEDFDRQVLEIEANWAAIEAIVEDRRIVTLRADGSYLPLDEVYARIFG